MPDYPERSPDWEEHIRDIREVNEARVVWGTTWRRPVVGVSWSGAEPGVEGTCLAEPTGGDIPIQVEVLDAEGQPVVGATVRGADIGAPQAKTGDDGMATLHVWPGRPVQLFVSLFDPADPAPGHAQTTFEPVGPGDFVSI